MLIYILLKATKAKKVKFDPWIVDYAYKRLGSAVIYYTPKIILIEYDRTTQYKDLKKFVDEISNNSNGNRFYVGVGPSTLVVQMKGLIQLSNASVAAAILSSGEL